MRRQPQSIMEIYGQGCQRNKAQIRPERLADFYSGFVLTIGNRTKKKRGRAWQSQAAPYFDRVPRFLVRHSNLVFAVRAGFLTSGKDCSCEGKARGNPFLFRFTVAAPPGIFTQIPLLSTSGDPACIPVRFACRTSIARLCPGFKSGSENDTKGRIPDRREFVPCFAVCAPERSARQREKRIEKPISPVILISDRKVGNDFRDRIVPGEAKPAEHNGHIWSRAPQSIMDIYGQGLQRSMAQFWPERIRDFY